ncbi:MAG: flagellar type III secretion system pore protein FliP [Leptospiraceae bacterium]|nr:flagellar type III secretion system pore protein FliP [Leptospiraceae bacterium]MBK7056785.1 flagellar type III secretion system pore protein FliP [Leptospiraceae bacterium]MBK9498850.1 flagellar type III secretion system pore protein FliP [Leptospiraceae bacterium]MBP9163610.1 flagellar type III secretion system pore protein FliP [Leptospiraceae bacterium]
MRAKKKFLSKVLNRWVTYLLSLKPLIKFILVSFLAVFILGIGAELYAQSTNTRIPIPNLSFNVNEAKNPKETSLSLMILFLVTILSLAPAIIMSVTSFTKIVIVMDFVRRALAVQNLPPNQVMVGLAIFMTFFIMAPTLGTINDKALTPYLDGKIETNAFFEKAMVPLREFMMRQIGKSGTKDVALFLKLGKVKQVKSFEEVPSYVLIPAFMLSELKKAFIIGIYLFIPFIIIDIVVASTLLSMGLMMLPPVMISLPFKLILFVLIDGWNLLVFELVRSYK